MSPIALPPESLINAATGTYPFVVKVQPSLREAHVVVQDLKRLFADDRSCQVLGRNDDSFDNSATIFNGAIKAHAMAVVKPTNAAHVSKTVKYCREHGIDLSVKGGGSGVHGQSVAGQIIIDLCLMNDISISLPSPSATTLHESFSRLHLGSIPSNSTESTFLSVPSATKRSAHDAGVEDEEGCSKRREHVSRESDRSPGGSSSSSNAGRGVNGSRIDGSTPDGDLHMSDSSGSSSRSGSAASAPADRTAQLTPSTSIYGESTPIKSPSPMRSAINIPSSSFSSHGSSSSIGESSGRTTYVNPSPTAPNAFPFISTTFSSHPSSYAGRSPGSFVSPSAGNPSPPEYTVVTFGAGTHSKQLDAATAKSPYGAYAVASSAFPVGAGQFLLGGFGFIGRKHGLAMDNVVEAEVVLADGRIVWVGADGKYEGDWKENENPEDLWWALRGAGPAMGIVTRFRVKAYYLPSVYAGNLIYIFDRSTTPSLMRHIRDCTKGSPRTLYANMILTAGPPGAPAILVVQLCFSGERSEGEMYVQTISSWDGGRCMFQDFSERSFERQQLAVEEVLKGGYGKKWYIKSDMLESMTDEVIDETCERFQAIPDGCTWLFEFTGGGAQGDVKDSCYPLAHRQSMYTVAALHQWAHDEPPALDSRCVTTAQEWINEVIRPNSTGGPLPCSSTVEDVRPVYGENYNRLLAVKSAFDPDDFMKHNMYPRANGPNELQQLPPLTQARVIADTAGKGKGKQRANGSNGIMDGINNVDNIRASAPDQSSIPGTDPPAKAVDGNTPDWIDGETVMKKAEEKAANTPGDNVPSTIKLGASAEASEISAFQRFGLEVVEPVRGGDDKVA